MHRIFGNKENEIYHNRKGAYLIAVKDGKVALVKTKKGYFLLGGKIEFSESDEECIIRECLEETGFSVKVGEFVCSAEMFAKHEKIGYFHPIQHYYCGEFIRKIQNPTEAEHTFEWVDYDLAKGNLFVEMQNWALEVYWRNFMTEKDYIIRLETEKDYREVEYMVRESFWNVYRPGCSEHYVLNQLRNDEDFVKELDFVMEKDGKIIGQNMFMKAHIQADDGRKIPIMTMGPICITPELKRKGYGKILLDYSIEKAKELGCGALCFEGNIKFYGKSGFDYASKFGIRYYGLPEGADASFFLCKELVDGYLDGVTGEYAPPKGYFVDENETEEFDKQFPPKVKLKLPGQLV